MYAYMCTFDCALTNCTRNFFKFQALDKIRFLALTDKEVLGEGDNTKLDIQVSCVNCINAGE